MNYIFYLVWNIILFNYIVVNFKILKINRDIRKLTRIDMLLKQITTCLFSLKYTYCFEEIYSGFSLFIADKN